MYIDCSFALVETSFFWDSDIKFDIVDISVYINNWIRGIRQYMDTSRLVSRDDSGTLWTYKHNSASKHVQQREHTPDDKTIVVVNNFIQSLQVPPQVSPQMSPQVSLHISPQVSPQMSPQKLCENEGNKLHNLVTNYQQNENHQNSQQTCKKDMDLFNFIMLRIDDLSSIYTDNMVRDAIQTLKDRLVLLLTDGPVPDKFGPKKSRTLLSWVTNNKRGTPASDESAATVAEFASWFLDISISIIPKNTVATDAVDSDSTKARSKSKSKSKIESTLNVCIATASPSTPSPFTIYRKKGAWWITCIE